MRRFVLTAVASAAFLFPAYSTLSAEQSAGEGKEKTDVRADALAFLERYQKELYNSVVRDGLTGCYNKKFFGDRIESEFSYSLRHGQPLSLIMFDIDHFKKVNDTYGHQAGDQVLKELASVVNRCIRGEDIFARYGGEEFALLLRDTNAERSFILADRIRRTVAAHRFVFKRTRIPVTISLGIATLQGTSLADTDEMIRVSDEYLYKAKHSGRDRVESEVTEVENLADESIGGEDDGPPPMPG